MAGVSGIKNTCQQAKEWRAEALPSLPSEPIWDGVRIPPAVTFGALLAAEPLTVQEAPAEQGWQPSKAGEEVFPGWGRGRGRGSQRGTLTAELQPYVRTPLHGSGEFPRSWNCGFTCGSGSVGLRIAPS